MEIQASHHRSPSLVLIVDPDETARALYRQAFATSSHDVVEAADGRDGLVKALVRPPALVLTELHLPLVDGYSLCEILRADHSTADARLIVITSERNPAAWNHVRSAGADAILLKPISVEALITETRRLIAASRELRGSSVAGRERAAEQIRTPHQLLARSNRLTHAALVKTHQRYTTSTPPMAPPDLKCPVCNRLLRYERSHIGGVSQRHPEQWDYFVCPAACGSFEFRQRTRRLRPAG
jgi:two-component system chemotaxis response regulator CheY